MFRDYTASLNYWEILMIHSKKIITIDTLSISFPIKPYQHYSTNPKLHSKRSSGYYSLMCKVFQVTNKITRASL